MASSARKGPLLLLVASPGLLGQSVKKRVIVLLIKYRKRSFRMK